MRWYQRIPGNYRPHNLVAETINFGDVLARWDLTIHDCKPVEDWPEDAWMAARRIETDGAPDDVLACFLPAPIFSERLRAALDAIGVTDLQYLPVDVRRSTGVSVGTFYAIQVLTRIAALESRRSDVYRFPDDDPLVAMRGQVMDMRRPVIHASRLAGHDVVRLAEFPVLTLFSQRFKDAFEANQCTGWVLEPVEVVE